MTELSPIRREIVVDADPARAFAVFTEQIGAWWPVAELSVYGAGTTVAFEDGALVERAADGRRTSWGEVRRWEPGVALAFSWHPGRDAQPASEVTVTFAPHDDSGRTLVVLEHAGWEVFADPAGARAEYEHGWPMVLDRYREIVDGADVGGEAPATWVALMHTPGPSAPTDGSLFADPRFGEHVAFLQRMHARGFLVAAGPLTDHDGAGMTILRLPGEAREAEATELATTDDVAVTSGLLDVAVRPWSVMLHTVA